MKNRRKDRAFTPLEIDNSLSIRDGNASNKIFKDRRFLSLAGFTLMELTMVVIIISILVSIAVPKFFLIVEKSRQSEAIDILSKTFRGYKRLQIDGCATVGASWTDLDFEQNPNIDAKFFSFNYYGNNATVFAQRLGHSSQWLQIDLNTGNITKSDPYN